MGFSSGIGRLDRIGKRCQIQVVVVLGIITEFNDFIDFIEVVVCVDP